METTPSDVEGLSFQMGKMYRKGTGSRLLEGDAFGATALRGR